jgi:hypothetical protein
METIRILMDTYEDMEILMEIWRKNIIFIWKIQKELRNNL